MTNGSGPGSFTSITFNQPSEGNVDSTDSSALTVNSHGTGIQCFAFRATYTGPQPVPPDGVYGKTNYAGASGVHGDGGDIATGVYGESKQGVAVKGFSSNGGAGYFESTASPTQPGLTAVALVAKNIQPQGIAAFFDHTIQVTGDILLSNADCAEEFEISTPEVEPGTVMVLNETGSLAQSYQAYDKKVAGVVSGAGHYKPGIILDRKEKVAGDNRLPIALMGKTYCKVDASYGVIETGDLLTTSLTPGHAMRATDPLKAFGSVIGKALCSLKTGTGLIPILIALQ